MRSNASTQLGILCFLVLLVVASSVFGRGKHVLVEDHTIIDAAGISGEDDGGTPTKRIPGNDAILLGIGGGERKYHPCYLELTWGRKNQTEHRTFRTEFWIPPCSDELHSYKWVSIDREPGSVEDLDTGIREIKVCINKRNNRLKGIEISKTMEFETGLDSQYNLADPKRYSSTDCFNNWQDPSTCDAGLAAVGVYIYHDDDDINGLKLICGKPQYTGQ